LVSIQLQQRFVDLGAITLAIGEAWQRLCRTGRPVFRHLCDRGAQAISPIDSTGEVGPREPLPAK
jgi:hypothetical protein